MTDIATAAHSFVRPGQVAADLPAPDACVRCGKPEGEHGAKETMSLPEGTHLAYIVVKDAWYASAAYNRDEKPTVSVMASHEDGGVAWEFAVVEFDLDGPSVHLEMFYDSFAALSEMPEFFAGLQQIGKGDGLAAVVALLDSLGAADETKRVSPYAEHKPQS